MLVLGLTQLGSLALTMRKLAGATERREIAPQPLQVVATPAHAPTDKTLCDERHQEIARRFMDIETNYRETRDSMAKIHRRINDLVEALGPFFKRKA